MKLADGTDDPQWLQWRREGVTATDVADAMAGTYGGLYGVVARKLGLIAVEQNAVMQRGHDWQETTADAVHVLTGWFVVGEEAWCAHRDDPRWRATLDGFLARAPEVSIEDVEAVLEVKTKGLNVRPNRDRWRIQTQWQMLVADLPRALLAEATINDIDNECVGVRLEWVDADPHLQAQLVEMAERIWEHVQAGTLPDPDSPSALDDVKVLTAVADADAVSVDLVDIEADVVRFAEIKDALKAVSDEKDLLEARIRSVLGEATKGTLDGWRVSLSKPAMTLPRDAEAELLAAHPQFAKPVLDRDRLKAEDPELLDAFRKPIGARRLTVTPKETR